MSLLSDIAVAIKTKLGGTSINNTIPRYDGTTCTLKNSNVTISDSNEVTAEGGFVGNLTGTASNATLAASATKLETARTINGVSFNGTSNITIADPTKAPLTGGGASGTWGISITGNASTANNAALAANATKLATARFINGVAFDGTSDITITDSTKAPLNGTGATGTWGINITGNAATATNVSGGRAIVYGTGNDYNLGGVEVLGDGQANTVFPTIGFRQGGLYASSLQLRGDGDFRFYTQGAGSYANVTANDFIGNLSGNAATATKLSTNRNNYKNITDSSVVGELMWKDYGNGHTIFDASNSTTPTGVAKNNTNPDVAWTATCPTLMGYNGEKTYGVRVDSARLADSAVAFNTAVGSAPSYACRAWVNFNGTGTVAVRASGNVSSITDNGVGFYTINFITNMPDNYAPSFGVFRSGVHSTIEFTSILDSSIGIYIGSWATGTSYYPKDLTSICVTITV